MNTFRKYPVNIKPVGKSETLDVTDDKEILFPDYQQWLDSQIMTEKELEQMAKDFNKPPF